MFCAEVAQPTLFTATWTACYNKNSNEKIFLLPHRIALQTDSGTLQYRFCHGKAIARAQKHTHFTERRSERTRTGSAVNSKVDDYIGTMRIDGVLHPNIC